MQSTNSDETARDAQTVLGLRWSQKSYCRFYRALSQNYHHFFRKVNQVIHTSVLIILPNIKAHVVYFLWYLVHKAKCDVRTDEQSKFTPNFFS